MGLMLAKLTSSRLSLHVTMLYRAEVERRLEVLASTLERFDEDLRTLMHKLAEAFQPVPEGDSPNPGPSIAKFRLDARPHGRGNGQRARNHHSRRGSSRTFWTSPGTRSLKGTSAALGQCMYVLSQILVSLPATARSDSLDGATRERIRAMSVTSTRSVLRCHRTSQSQHVQNEFAQARDNCREAALAMFSTPPPRLQGDQPDQVLARTTPISRLPVQESKSSPDHGRPCSQLEQMPR